MMMEKRFTIEKTKAELISRFDNNEWNSITITIKSTGDSILITPCSQVVKNITCEKDCEWFLMDCDSVNLTGHDNLDDVADTLNRFVEIKNQNKDEKIKLREYYDDNIAGYDDDDLILGHKVSRIIYDAWMSTKCKDKLYDFADKYMPNVAKELDISIDKATMVYTLSCHMSTYSDWHKDVYGYRPI